MGRLRSPGLRTVVALLSPFLVPRLQLLRSIPQEDVVLFLGVVVLIALRDSESQLVTTLEQSYQLKQNERESFVHK